MLEQCLPFTVLKRIRLYYFTNHIPLQQHLPFTVCAEGCETAEEQSDDEVRTSQVPERREGKTKMRKQQHLPFTVLKPPSPQVHMLSSVTLQQYLPFTVLKHIIRNFTHRRAHKLQQHLPLAVLKLIWSMTSYINHEVATVPTVYGMRRRVRDSRGAKRR